MPSPASSTSSVDDIVPLVVAAKRALGTQTVLWRATELVDTARALLHENAALAARNTALHALAEQQVDALEAVRRGIDAVGSDVDADFKQLLHQVDTAFASLNTTLARLRDTPIEAALQPPGAPQKHLYDFIDGATVSTLEASLRACIDRYNDARATLDNATHAFDTDLLHLHASLDHLPTPSLDSKCSRSGYNPSYGPSSSPVPRLYHHLETHAKEAAQAFQSLVQHYDLCITALRHTEGASVAATYAPADLPDLTTTTAAAATSPDPMTDEDHHAMLAVLRKDSLQVDDVMGEIRARGAEMDSLLAQITDHVAHLRRQARALTSLLQTIAHTTRAAYAHLATSRTFHNAWLSDTQPALLRGIDEWEAQREFHLRFDLAYAELLVEISARRRRHDKARRKAADAQRELDRLTQEDERYRDEFVRSQGDFLPLDIWPGLREKPAVWEVREVRAGSGLDRDLVDADADADANANANVEEGQAQGIEVRTGVESIPRLERHVVEKALARVKHSM